MVTRKEREKEEEAERKAEEKAAKKAEIAAKRAARDAEKAAKLAEKQPGPRMPSSPSKAGVGEKDEDAWTADESEALVDGLRANPRGMHATEQARWEAIAGGAGLEKRATRSVVRRPLTATCSARKAAKAVQKLKKKPMRNIKKEQEEGAARAKKAAAEARRLEELRVANGGRLSAEELGFFIRSGPGCQPPSQLQHGHPDQRRTAVRRKQELLQDAVLEAVHGTKYGLVGRNGTGKSTLLHAISDRVDPHARPHPHHPRRAGSGASDLSALQTVLDTDAEELPSRDRKDFVGGWGRHRVRRER